MRFAGWPRVETATLKPWMEARENGFLASWIRMLNEFALLQNIVIMKNWDLYFFLLWRANLWASLWPGQHTSTCHFFLRENIFWLPNKKMFRWTWKLQLFNLGTKWRYQSVLLGSQRVARPITLLVAPSDHMAWLQLRACPAGRCASQQPAPSCPPRTGPASLLYSHSELLPWWDQPVIVCRSRLNLPCEKVHLRFPVLGLLCICPRVVGSSRLMGSPGAETWSGPRLLVFHLCPYPGRRLGIFRDTTGQKWVGVNVHVDPTHPSPIADKQLGPGSSEAPWAEGGAGQLCSTLASAADTLDSLERTGERAEFIWHIEGDLFGSCTSFNMSWVGRIFQGVVRVERWPRATVLTTPEDSVSGAPWDCAVGTALTSPPAALASEAGTSV